MVVLVIARDQLQVAIARKPRLVVSLVEEEEFEFRCHEGLHAHGFEPGDLLLQDRTRRMRHFRMGGMVEHVA